MRFKITHKGKPLRGLGDAVAVAADPVKQAIIHYGPSAVAEWMRHCRCPERIAWLNRMLRFRVDS